MPEEACADCGAKLARDALWCSLCYAPVRSAVAVPAESLPEPNGGLPEAFPSTDAQLARDVAADLAEAGWSAYSDASSGDTSEYALSNLPPERPRGRHAVGRDVLVATAPQAAPASAVPGTESVTTRKPAKLAGMWPCLGCGSQNTMGDNACTACGLPFLAFAKTPPTLNIPGVGDIFRRSRPYQIAFIAAFGLIALGVLVGLMALFGLAV